jgi:hypothetical protein
MSDQKPSSPHKYELRRSETSVSVTMLLSDGTGSVITYSPTEPHKPVLHLVQGSPKSCPVTPESLNALLKKLDFPSLEPTNIMRVQAGYTNHAEPLSPALCANNAAVAKPTPTRR